MSMVNKEPYITPEMIAAWNAGESTHTYRYEHQRVEVNTAWGSWYFGKITLTLPIKIQGKKFLVNCEAEDSAFTYVSRKESGLTDYQTVIQFFRPNAADFYANVTIMVID